MAGLSVFCVEMNVRVLSMFCGSVLLTRISLSPQLGIRGMALHVVGGQRNGKSGKFSHSGRVAGKLCVADDLLCVRSCKLGSADLCGSVLFTRIRGKGLWLSLGPY